MATLTLISLPIGNLSDITTRARQALMEGEYFLAEDTRNFKQLLGLLEINFQDKKIDSFHDHSQEKIEKYMQLLDQGKNLYLVSDAGSPVISDPAYPLIVQVLERGHQLETCPGVSSLLVALELSGLPPQPFHFYGFLPREQEKKGEIFQSLPQGTSLFFESPHRIEQTLELLAKVGPDTQVAVVREATKKFESVYRFKAKEWKDANINVKGEFVLVLNEMSSDKKGTMAWSKVDQMARECLTKGASVKQISKLIAQITGLSAKEVYTQLNKGK